MVEIVAILVLVGLNGLFAASEIAVIALRRGRVRQLLDEGERRAAVVSRLHADPDRFFATVQIGITVVGTLASALGGVSAMRVLQPIFQRSGWAPLADHAEALALLLVVVPIAYLSLVLGELVPKSLALRRAEWLALRVARPIELLGRLAAPLVWLLTRSSNLLLRPLGDSTSFSESRLTLDEVRAIVDEGTEVGAVPADVGEAIDRTFALEHLRVADLLVPRTDVVTLDLAASAAQVREVLAARPHGLIPVVRGTLDDVQGYVRLQDLVPDLLAGRIPDLRTHLRRAPFVPMTTPVRGLLATLRAYHEGLAFAVDEFGGVAGIVTRADVVNEIAGSLVGEAPREAGRIERMPDGVIIAGGEAPVRDVERALGLELPNEAGNATIGGLVVAAAGCIPPRGSQVQLGRVRARIEQGDERQVTQLRLEEVPSPDGGTDRLQLHQTG